MGTVASELKSEREKRKISLSHIAAETRISLRHLQSLEEGRFSDLPGGIYNRAFLKAYCEILNLDTQSIMQRFDSEISPVSEKPAKTKVHLPQQTSSFRISPVLIWGVLFAVSAAGLFFSRNWITAIFSPYFSHTPDASVRYEPVQTPPRQKQPESTPAPVPAATVEPVTTPGQTAPAETTIQPGVAPPSSPAVPSSTPTPEPAASAQGLRLEINATEKCWISVTRDGNSKFQKTMEPGEVQSLNAVEKFQIIFGNAGGVRLKVNGKPAKPLGKPGEVVSISIDGKNLQDILDKTAG